MSAIEGEPMQLEMVIGSPTELAEDDESEMEGRPGRTSSSVKLEKKKRGADRVDASAVQVPESSDDENIDSPSKRPSRAEGDDIPMTGRELRALLFGHMAEMKESWQTFQARLGDVEHAQKHTNTVVQALKNRTKILEKDNLTNQQMIQQTGKNLDELTEEVKNMKVQMDEFQRKAASVQTSGPVAPAIAPLQPGARPPPPPSDPWAAYLARRHAPPADQPDKEVQPGGEKDTLSEDEKRTLVIGGWLRDTKRSVIEEEISPLLNMGDMKALVDSDKLQIYGPRRSVGMLKFVLRQGESPADLRNRMWETVKLCARLKMELPSTRTSDDVKTVCASFVKTKAARAKSAPVSMVRRVAIDIAMNTKSENGAPVHLPHTLEFGDDLVWGR